MQIGRPHAKVRFGATGKLNTSTKPVVRDEIGDMQITVAMNETLGKVQILFDRPADMLALPPDKAYDFAHLILEQVKGDVGEPVNITEEKIIDALSFALAKHGIGAKMEMSPRDLAVLLGADFMTSMAGAEPEVEEAESSMDDSGCPCCEESTPIDEDTTEELTGNDVPIGEPHP